MHLVMGLVKVYLFGNDGLEDQIGVRRHSLQVHNRKSASGYRQRVAGCSQEVIGSLRLRIERKVIIGLNTDPGPGVASLMQQIIHQAHMTAN